MTYELTVAGRTDAGVHARGQVAHVDLPEEVWAEHGEQLLRRLAGRLPHGRADLAGRARRPRGFNARFSAIWRRYAYRVDATTRAGSTRSSAAMCCGTTGRWTSDAMNEAARAAAGGARLRGVLQEARGRDDDPYAPAAAAGCGDADGVLEATVRRTRSATTWCARWSAPCCSSATGTVPPEWPAKVLAAGVRDSAVHVVRPHGLTLEEVGYPADEELAARNLASRNKRTLAGGVVGGGLGSGGLLDSGCC